MRAIPPFISQMLTIRSSVNRFPNNAIRVEFEGPEIPQEVMPSHTLRESEPND